MTPTRRVAWGVALAFAISCGGGGGGSELGGVDPNEPLSSVTAAQAAQLCMTLAPQYPAKMVSCGSDETLTIGYGSDDCTGSGYQPVPAGCTATVGDDVDCFQALYDGGSAVLCGSALPAACADVYTPACEGSAGD
jgi:hypothetical protein